MKHTMIVAAAFGLLMSAAQLGVAADGKEVYDKKCGGCHNKGMMGAPKLGDKAAWETRAKAGEATLDESVAKGKGKMPKQDIPADDIKAANAYILKAVQ